MKSRYILPVLCILLLAACKKPKTTNNYYSPPANTQPAFAVNGITDITFTNYFNVNASLYLSVEYLDSAQENVNLLLSGMPTGVAMDTNWVHNGIPTFATTLSVYDTGIAAPGNYPLTLTATTTSGKQKFYTFNLKVNATPTSFLGKYTNCHVFCDSTVAFTDSVYMDPTVVNKVWFANYFNSGHAVYGILTGSGGITVPAQTISGVTYAGSGNISLPHSIVISVSGNCALNMF